VTTLRGAAILFNCFSIPGRGKKCFSSLEQLTSSCAFVVYREPALTSGYYFSLLISVTVIVVVSLLVLSALRVACK
jgi:hypothetical protein